MSRDWQAMFGDPPRAFDVSDDDLRLRHCLAIWFNGEPHQGVKAFNIDEGWIEQIVMDGDRPKLFGSGNDAEYRYERVHGSVEVNWITKETIP